MPVNTEQVVREIERMTRRRVSSLASRPSPYQTSHAIEELDVQLDEELRARLVLKSVGQLLAAADGVKPDFVVDRLREPEVYEQFLSQSDLSTPRWYGTSIDPTQGRYWLFLERVEGAPLTEFGELEVWEHAARWLARLHSEEPPPLRRPLVFDDAYLRRWAARARELSRCSELERIVSGYDRVVATLTSLPRVLLHGEFYASNILVVGGRPPRICPVDWEMAALGPPLVDLAALTAGSWRDDDRAAIVAAYRQALPQTLARRLDPVFDEALECCRLHLALQWLGWSPEWARPPEHDQDWLGISIAAAANLGL